MSGRPVIEPPVPASGRQLELAAGELRVVVTEVGAALRSFTAAGVDVLDGFGSDEPATFAQGQALIPWPNRLADGRYEFSGQAHQLPLSEPAKHNAIHGLVRWANWQIDAHDVARVRLSLLLHPQPGYPFALFVEVEYSLDECEGLTVCTTARNVGREPLPYGTGFHPYITVGTDTIDTSRLQIPAQARLELDERGIPTGRRLPPDGRSDFRLPREIGCVALDTAFAELDRDADGRARVRLEAPDASRSVTMWLGEAYAYAMAFTGDSLPDPARRRRSLGIEPMTCAPNAFQSGNGLRTLERGESFSSTWGIVSAVQPGAG